MESLLRKSWHNAVARDATKVSQRQPQAYRVGASQHQVSLHTRHRCRIPPPVMYGMNQQYNAPDPSAQVPNHLVRAFIATPSSTTADRIHIAHPCPPDLLVPLPNIADPPACGSARVPHQRPADSARHVARGMDLLLFSAARWHRPARFPTPTHGHAIRI